MVLSEERLSPREEKTYVFVRHFFLAKMLLWDCLHFIQAIPHFCKKNGGERGIRTLGYSPCEITLKKMFYSAF